ncbi:MAG: hypothetical protein WCI73_05930, partial [Phycisphaerae bacterium]
DFNLINNAFTQQATHPLAATLPLAAEPIVSLVTTVSPDVAVSSDAIALAASVAMPASATPVKLAPYTAPHAGLFSEITTDEVTAADAVRKATIGRLRTSRR